MSATEGTQLPHRAASGALVFADSSVLVAIALDQRGAEWARDRLVIADRRWASPLLQAEYASACRRERIQPPTEPLSWLHWVSDTGPLSAEIATVLAAGHVSGADCWHLATALWLAPDPSELTFLTLDERQRAVADRLGFRT
jgi:hypothetical protein